MMNFPKNILIIGGGRWARVIVSVLVEILPKSTKLIIYTNNNIMSKWSITSYAQNNISIINDINEIKYKDIDAAIVANSARKHFVFSKKLIMNQIPVLIEKPISSKLSEVLELFNLSKEMQVKVAISQIIMFTQYIKNYKEKICEFGKVNRLHIDWHDEEFENRYAEVKYYDAGVPIYLDCLPHILMIANYLCGGSIDKCESIDLKNGGAYLSLKLTNGEILLSVSIRRNYLKRKRYVCALVGNKTVNLDFTVEPGIISSDNFTINADEKWDINEKPLSIMLSNFINWSIGVVNKEYFRFSDNITIYRVIDQVKHMYYMERNKILLDYRDGKNINFVEFKYLLTEILLVKKHETKKKLDKKI
jgi:hypothetical protein